jgi:3-methyl-2-oxobutanoate hydroxymethyltransferase
LLEDALLLQEAGCFGIVLEAIPGQLARLVSERLTIPTIGIGAGNGCDGQVLVTHDLLGFFDRFTPKFVKQYARLHGDIADALAAFRKDVEARTFPAAEHTIEMPEAEWDAFMEELGGAA